MSIYDYDNDFATYDLDKDARKKLGQVWTPYELVCRLMDKCDPETWTDSTKTMLEPTMGSGNIVIGMLYRRIVEYKMDPVAAISTIYGIEMDPATYEHCIDRIRNFMKHFCDEKDMTFVEDTLKYNFVCSDFFKWNIPQWRPYTEEELLANSKKKK
jgi:hypothetical protein